MAVPTLDMMLILLAFCTAVMHLQFSRGVSAILSLDHNRLEVLEKPGLAVITSPLLQLMKAPGIFFPSPLSFLKDALLGDLLRRQMDAFPLS